MVKARGEIERIERDFGLARTGGREQPTPDLSSGSFHEARRTGVQPFADRVREEAGSAFAAATGWRDLEERLAALGYRIERAERGSGLVATDGLRRAALSRIDRSLSAPKLAARFGETFAEHRARHPEPPTVEPREGAHVAPLPGRSLRERAAALVERVGTTRATFTEADLKRAAFHQPESAALLRLALHGADLVELGRDARGARRFSSREYLETEARLFTAASALADRRNLRLDPAAVERTLERAPQLSAEQRAAVLHATAESDLAQIVGRAGAGKTTAARAIADAYRAAGYAVHGGALAGKAAEGLGQEAGIASRTLASWEHAWSEGRDALTGRSVLLIDEAGMIDVRQLARVLGHADERGAKAVLLGDPDQLPPIGAGDAYRGLLEVHPSARLEEIRRQAEPWQREASMQLASGRVVGALDAYEGAGRLHWSDTRVEGRAGLVERYLADRTVHPDSRQLVLAYRNADVALLNAAIRGARTAAGELAPGVAVGGVEYAAGDRLVFLRNDHPGRQVANLEAGAASAGVKNGTLGTVEAAEERRFTVRLDDGRRVAFDPRDYDAIAHGYAVTIHKSQGATVDRSYLLTDPMMNRGAAYVGLTRHRDAVHVYADRETFASRDDLDRMLSRATLKDLGRDYGAATLERAAARARTWRDQATALRREEQSLRVDLQTLERAGQAIRDVAEARVALVAAAVLVYADPAAAVRSLTADGQALDRLAAGQAAGYGELRRSGWRFGRGAMGEEARAALPRLRSALDRHGRAVRSAETQIELAAAIRMTAPELQARLERVSATLRPIEKAARAADQALAKAARQLGPGAAQAAVTLLLRPLRNLARTALRAIEREMDLGLGR